ncbi:MAG: hypothetical protein LBQ66_08260 [Planctomycetaceae bacterium]|nr:hypothetical protein [Planctomycetaceae bacterium]
MGGDTDVVSEAGLWTGLGIRQEELVFGLAIFAGLVGSGILLGVIVGGMFKGTDAKIGVKICAAIGVVFMVLLAVIAWLIEGGEKKRLDV